MAGQLDMDTETFTTHWNIMEITTAILWKMVTKQKLNCNLHDLELYILNFWMTVKCLLSFLYCNLYLISYVFIHVSHIFISHILYVSTFIKPFILVNNLTTGIYWLLGNQLIAVF